MNLHIYVEKKETKEKKNKVGELNPHYMYMNSVIYRLHYLGGKCHDQQQSTMLKHVSHITSIPLLNSDIN